MALPCGVTRQIDAVGRRRFILCEGAVAVECVSGCGLRSFMRRCCMHESRTYRPLVNRFYPDASPRGSAHA